MRLIVGACPSLTAEVVSKLESHGIRNMNDFMLKDCEDLAKETSVSYTDIISIRRVAIAHYSVFAVTGQDLLQEAIHNTKVFTTGSKNLDKLLDGGLTTGEVVEVCGGPGEGKTALCIQLALHAAINLGLSVLYVDPVNSVNHLRMRPIVEALPHDLEVVDKTLSRIKVMHVSDIWELFSVLNIPQKPLVPINSSSQDGSVNQTKIKMVIVDALPLVMMPLITKEDSKQGLGILNQLAVKLKTVAKEQQVVVVVVNDVVRGDSDHYNHHHHTHKPTRWIPALGRFWRFVPQIRLYMRRVKETSAPVRVDRHTKSESLVLKSPMDVNVAVWQGTRVKPARALVTLPFESLTRVDTNS